MDRFGNCDHVLNSLDEIGRGMCDACCEKCKTPEDKAFEVIERKLEADKVHPLLNPESKHYSMVDDVEAIARMEQMYSKDEMQIWAKITAMKYRLRIGNKDNVVKEAKKIETYEDYYRYLEEQLKHGAN